MPDCQSQSSFGICNTIGCGRCPIRQGLEAGVPFPVGLSPLRLLAMGLFSQAPHLGGLPRASRVPFRGSFFTSDCIHPTLRPKGSSSACTGGGVFHSWHQCASWRTQIEEPVLRRDSTAFHFHPTLTGMLGTLLIRH
jgi:hypothetical protein